MQTVGLNRNTIDKYYTKPAIVELCAQAIQTHISPTRDDYIIEPSAGGGAFIDAIKQMTNNHLFIDLEPGIQKYNNVIICPFSHHLKQMAGHMS